MVEEHSADEDDEKKGGHLCRGRQLILGLVDLHEALAFKESGGEDRAVFVAKRAVGRELVTESASRYDGR